MEKPSDKEDKRGSPDSPRPFIAADPFEPLIARFGGQSPAHITEDHIQSVLSVRRGREALFGAHLFSDPAWDIILELYAAELGGRTTTGSELARAIGAPHPVIVRWLNLLSDEGLVVLSSRRNSEGQIVRLSDSGGAKLRQLVDHWTSAFLAI